MLSAHSCSVRTARTAAASWPAVSPLSMSDVGPECAGERLLRSLLPGHGEQPQMLFEETGGVRVTGLPGLVDELVQHDVVHVVEDLWMAEHVPQFAGRRLCGQEPVDHDVALVL